MATIQLAMKQKEMERYLKEMSLYQAWNDLMYPPHCAHDPELNPLLKSVYVRLEEIHNTVYPCKMKQAAKKGNTKFVFKNEADFEKGFGEYFERRLIVACLRETVKHPDYSKEKISEIVRNQANDIFDQAVSYVFNEMTYVINEDKITHGQQPFDFI